MLDYTNARNAQVEAAFKTYADMVYKIALSQMKCREDAEDVFQNVFLSLVGNKKEITSDEHLKAWLIHVTLNHCRKLFASAYRRKTVPLTMDIATLTPEEHNVLDEVLALPPKYRLAIHLFYYEDMSIEAIAANIGANPSTVKSHLHRGRLLLREKLKGEYGFHE
jgi:RNA polymerase sigma-70 factor (ECF subfamily)